MTRTIEQLLELDAYLDRQHTPLPWYNSASIAGGNIHIDGDGITVVKAVQCERQEANAAYTTHCANVYPDMIHHLRTLSADALAKQNRIDALEGEVKRLEADIITSAKIIEMLIRDFVPDISKTPAIKSCMEIDKQALKESV